jgi:hypothetical protein
MNSNVDFRVYSTVPGEQLVHARRLMRTPVLRLCEVVNPGLTADDESLALAFAP